jgi:phosphoenolpyruvate carboxylase
VRERSFSDFRVLQGRGREWARPWSREKISRKERKPHPIFSKQKKLSKKLNRFVNYVPADPDVAAMLKREGPDSAKDPYKAAVEDAMIITMKGISAGMQNTG